MKKRTVPVFLFPVILVVLLAGLLRLLFLGSAPRGVLVDEASFGYNAYSILKTGKDEWGKSFPLVFKAFGDQKLPAYVYVDVPFVAAFGLNNTAVRLPSALAGIAFVAAMYLLLRELGLQRWSSAIGSLVAAVSPWTVILSRFGYESNLALLSFTLGLLFISKAVRTKRPIHLVLSGLFFAATWYAYIAYRMVTILFLAGFVTIALRKKLMSPRRLLPFIAGFLVTIAPLLPLVLSRTGTARFTQIGILSDPGPALVIQEQRNYCAMHLPRFFCYAVWNKATIYGGLAIERFVSLLSPEYLFLKGDEFLPYLNVDRYGQFFLILLPFYILGIYALFTTKKRALSLPLFISLGVLAAAIPSILAGEPQKIRLSALLPFLIILMTLGIDRAGMVITKRLRVLGAALLSLALTVSSIFFIVSLLTVHVDKYDSAFNTPVAELMQYLDKQDNNVRIEIYPSFSDPVMQYAYLTEADPLEYQQTVEWGELEQSGFQHAKSFRNVTITNEPYAGKLCTLYVTDRNLGLGPLALKHSVKSSNGVHTLFYVYSADTPKWCP